MIKAFLVSLANITIVAVIDSQKRDLVRKKDT